MTIGTTDEQQTFADAIRSWCREQNAPARTRELLDRATDGAVELQLWEGLTGLGAPGLLVPENLGGSGAAWADAAVLVEALAASCMPLPLASTIAASAVIRDYAGSAGEALLTGVASGSVRAGVTITALGVSDRSGRLNGEVGAVPGAKHATHLCVVLGDDVLVAERDTPGVHVTERDQLDPSSGAAQVSFDDVDLASLLHCRGAARELITAVRFLMAADAVGVAATCLDMAVEYAKNREAFGRPIGSFQAVKHHCANMLLSSQIAEAAVWRAAEAMGTPDETRLTDSAVRLATNAALSCSKTTIQVLGGIGFTWEHDAHLYLRRAAAEVASIGCIDQLLEDIGRAELDGRRPSASLKLPNEATAIREGVRAFKKRLMAAPAGERHATIVDEGYLFPHWPRPWGRAAGAVEQLVIEEELAGVDRRSALGPTYWEVPIVLPTILECGNEEQIERWMLPTMLGEVRWCQLFSEPGAGSDLAALTTRAIPVEGGWRVTGQKVWTSDAHHAHVGMALVRTNPAAAKHDGITCMVVNMDQPGVEVRPLRQITGQADFNEVFLDGAFAASRDVIGPVDGGWNVARSTLGHERVSLSGGGDASNAWKQLMNLVRDAAAQRPALLRQAGDLGVTSDGLAALSLRAAHRAVQGQQRGIEGSIGKILTAEHAQQTADFAIAVLGEQTLLLDTESARPTTMFLQSRMSTIAGGTSEILRNLLAERSLGLPREPTPDR